MRPAARSATPRRRNIGPMVIKRNAKEAGYLVVLRNRSTAGIKAAAGCDGVIPFVGDKLELCVVGLSAGLTCHRRGSPEKSSVRSRRKRTVTTVPSSSHIE